MEGYQTGGVTYNAPFTYAPGFKVMNRAGGTPSMPSNYFQPHNSDAREPYRNPGITMPPTSLNYNIRSEEKEDAPNPSKPKPDKDGNNTRTLFLTIDEIHRTLNRELDKVA